MVRVGVWQCEAELRMVISAAKDRNCGGDLHDVFITVSSQQSTNLEADGRAEAVLEAFYFFVYRKNRVSAEESVALYLYRYEFRVL
jgi:hypothetical protein